MLYFGVNGLYGYRNIGLKVEEGVGIFVADNGSGKTTLLYMLQAILNKNFSKLERFQYSKIEIKFLDGAEFSLPKYRKIDLDGGEYRYFQHGIFRLKAILNINDDDDDDKFFDVLYTSNNYEEAYDRLLKTGFFRKLLKYPSERTINIKIIRRELRRIYSVFDPGGDFGQSLPDYERMQSYREEEGLWKKLKSYLEENFKHSILYFPTYRRVEQGIGELVNLENRNGSLLSDVHFGMKDVEIRQSEITKQIRDHFVDSYAEISGSMLGQLAEKTPISGNMKYVLKDIGKVNLVLGRIGSYINSDQKESILKICESGEIFKNEYLTFFLYNLIIAYDKVKDLDYSLEQYACVCNSYLINKEMRYDRLNATVSVYEKINNSKIDLEDLSSGEKQLLGVMSELYLGDRESYVIIFDEPEISLSIEWQRKILVDIYNSPKTILLIAATHSPFIFENRLDKYASGMKVGFEKDWENGK